MGCDLKFESENILPEDILMQRTMNSKIKTKTGDDKLETRIQIYDRHYNQTEAEHQRQITMKKLWLCYVNTSQHSPSMSLAHIFPL